jgi:hypothetical protein
MERNHQVPEIPPLDPILKPSFTAVLDIMRQNPSSVALAVPNDFGTK